MGSPGRREIGHGKLAWRRIHPMLPPRTSSPTRSRRLRDHRVERLVLDGVVCGASLSLMDAGVPLRRPVAGIAMGLILEGERFAVLSDILGDEDHLGDMDFKVAGTDAGITSLQMDIKIAGITEEIMRVALARRRRARAHPRRDGEGAHQRRAELGEHAPRIEMMKIPTDKIREVIGTGGKVIREIVERRAPRSTSRTTARSRSRRRRQGDQGGLQLDPLDRAEPEAGTIYDGTVVKTMEFGAFVNFFGPKDGLVHISELAARASRR
jgi:polyribonucleotide nucleotidyltransferase